MTVLVYRYGSICEPDVIDAFKSIGLDVLEEDAEMNNKRLTPSEQVAILNEDIIKHHPLFVFSINFFPAIAEICHIRKVFYICWTVDCPVLELFSKSITYDTNRIFLFDHAQYEYFHPYNPECIFYLPLASATERFDTVISDITDSDMIKYSGDISFVGSLYSEKNPLKPLNNISDTGRGFIDGLIEAALKVYGYNFFEDALSPSVVREIKEADKGFYSPSNIITNCDSYVAAHCYIGYQAAELERIRTLNALAKYFPVDLYTRSDTAPLIGVHAHDGVKTLTEMPKIFHLSKINLNMTIKPIQTGLPLRIFDIMGCGGFVMTNYQAELPDYFTIGEDLEAYSGMDELIDKCSYYLTHEDERRQIAYNGYMKIKEMHSYKNRISEMIRRI